MDSNSIWVRIVREKYVRNNDFFNFFKKKKKKKISLFGRKLVNIENIFKLG